VENRRRSGKAYSLAPGQPLFLQAKKELEGGGGVVEGREKKNQVSQGRFSGMRQDKAICARVVSKSAKNKASFNTPNTVGGRESRMGGREKQASVEPEDGNLA